MAMIKQLFRHNLEGVPAIVQASIACVVAAIMLYIIHGFDLGACGLQLRNRSGGDICEFPTAVFWPLIAGAVILPPIVIYARKHGFDHIHNCLLVLLVSGLMTTAILPFIVPVIMPDTFLAGVMAGFVFSAAKNIASAKISHRARTAENNPSTD
ncbi:MAG: hypothetical protein AAFR27_02085 [Pseudomonadota bacterium]